MAHAAELHATTEDVPSQESGGEDSSDVEHGTDGEHGETMDASIVPTPPDVVVYDEYMLEPPPPADTE